MRLVPLIRNTPPLNRRPFGVPGLVNSPLPNAISFFQDFHQVSVGGALALGHYEWLATLLAGSGTAGVSAGTGGVGVLSAASGALANDGTMIEHVTRTGAGNLLSPVGTAKWIVQVRLQFAGTANAVTNSIYGFGLLPSGVAVGTDFITDPDTTLLGVSTSGGSIAITRHSATYSGDAAGDVVLRYYDAGVTDDFSAVLIAAAGITASTFYKIELYFDGSTLHYYVDGALVGSTALPNYTALSSRPAIAAIATGASARVIGMDSYYQETEQTSAR